MDYAKNPLPCSASHGWPPNTQVQEEVMAVVRCFMAKGATFGVDKELSLSCTRQAAVVLLIRPLSAFHHSMLHAVLPAQ